jgi:endoglucanase
VFVVDPSNPGSDILGTASAALAASAMVLKQYDVGYAQLLLDESVLLYQFGKAHQGGRAAANAIPSCRVAPHQPP